MEEKKKYNSLNEPLWNEDSKLILTEKEKNSRLYKETRNLWKKDEEKNKHLQ